MVSKNIFIPSGHSFVAVCMMLLLLACTNKQSSSVPTSNATNDTLLQADAILHSRLQAILNADDAYAQLVMQPVGSEMLDAKNETIVQAEIALQKTIDSLKQVPAKNGTTGNMQRIIGYFNAILESRRGLSDLRMVVSANSDDSTTMQQTLVQLRAQVQEKDKKIAALQRTGNKQTQPFIPNEERIADSGSPRYAPAKSESPADLKQRNKNLYQAYSDLQVKYFVLGRNYLVLKQEHDRTLKELAALRQPGNQ